jgi:hypothetical protein
MMTNPAEKAVNAEQRRKAVESLTKVGEAFKNMRSTTKVDYTPIGKSLAAIGIEPKTMDIMIGDEPVECLVIPLNELVYKEWRHMGGGINNQPKESDD